jgi:hypothetical protein
MDPFYTIIVAIAVILLIIVLIIIGIMMQKQDEDKAFPSYANKCPDGWTWNDISGNCVTNQLNKGTFTDISYTPDSNICANKTWTTTYGITWDGVSNYNKCVA